MDLTLTELIRLHDDLQRRFPPVGRAPQDLEGKEAIDFVVAMTYALEDELHEMTAEVGWKPWASSKHFNIAEYRAELVDALHFFLNLWMASFDSDATPDEMGHALAEGYRRERRKNLGRMEQGYDGVSGKCPGCRRDWLQVMRGSVTLTNPRVKLADMNVHCPCGRTLTKEEKEWLESRLSG